MLCCLMLLRVSTSYCGFSRCAGCALLRFWSCASRISRVPNSESMKLSRSVRQERIGLVTQKRTRAIVSFRCLLICNARSKRGSRGIRTGVIPRLPVSEFVRNRVGMQGEHLRTIRDKFGDGVRAVVPLFDQEVRGTAMLAPAAGALFD